MLTCGIWVKNQDTPTISATSNITEQGHCVYRHINSLQSSFGNNVVLSSQVDVAKWFGVKDVIDNDDLCSTVDTVPTDCVDYAIFCGPSLDAADMGIVNVFVELKYEVQYMEPKETATN